MASVIPLRVIIADDHVMFRVGLRAVLESAQISVVGEAANTVDAALEARDLVFDMLVTDVVLPPAGGAALVRAVLQGRPKLPILALSLVDEPVRVAELLRAGVTGYAVKTQPVEQIVEAVRCVAGGVQYLAPAIRTDDVHALAHSESHPLERLTHRERTVFDLLVEGRSNARVAAMLEISRSTVEAHRRHIMHKLEALSIIDLLRLARRHGVIGGQPGVRNT